MNGHFSEEALQRYAEMAAQTQSADFAEGDTYDFTRCVTPDGEHFGTKGRCQPPNRLAPNQEGNEKFQNLGLASQSMRNKRAGVINENKKKFPEEWEAEKKARENENIWGGAAAITDPKAREELKERIKRVLGRK